MGLRSAPASACIRLARARVAPAPRRQCRTRDRREPPPLFACSCFPWTAPRGTAFTETPGGLLLLPYCRRTITPNTERAKAALTEHREHLAGFVGSCCRFSTRWPPADRSDALTVGRRGGEVKPSGGSMSSVRQRGESHLHPAERRRLSAPDRCAHGEPCLASSSRQTNSWVKSGYSKGVSGSCVR